MARFLSIEAESTQIRVGEVEISPGSNCGKEIQILFRFDLRFCLV